MQATLPSAEAASGTQQTNPSPKPAGGGGGTKQDKERQRRERQRQRKLDETSLALQWAMEAIAEYGARCVRSHTAPSNLRLQHTHKRRTDGARVCVVEQREHGAIYERGAGASGEARISQRAAGSANGGGEGRTRAGASGSGGVSEGRRRRRRQLLALGM